jgi:hypothetical protein
MLELAKGIAAYAAQGAPVLPQWVAQNHPIVPVPPDTDAPTPSSGSNFAPNFFSLFSFFGGESFDDQSQEAFDPAEDFQPDGVGRVSFALVQAPPADDKIGKSVDADPAAPPQVSGVTPPLTNDSQPVGATPAIVTFVVDPPSAPVVAALSNPQPASVAPSAPPVSVPVMDMPAVLPPSSDDVDDPAPVVPISAAELPPAASTVVPAASATADDGSAAIIVPVQETASTVIPDAAFVQVPSQVGDSQVWHAWAFTAEDAGAPEEIGVMMAGPSATPQQDAALLLAGPTASDETAPVPHHRHATRTGDVAEASLPPSEVIRTIKEGSIAIRVHTPAAPAAMPVWFLDDVSGDLRQFGGGDRPDAVRLSVNDDGDDQTPADDAGSRHTTAVCFESQSAMNWSAASWLQVLRELRERWL